MLIAIQDNYILRAHLQADNRAILGLHLLKSGDLLLRILGARLRDVMATYFRKAFAWGTWVRFPRKGTVGGPGGKFRGRRLARNDLNRTVTTKAMGRQNRPTPERFVYVSAMLV